MDAEGNIEELVDDGFGAASNQYVWNMAEYNGKLIVGTYDTSTLTSGFTQLTDGTWLHMTKEEFMQRLQYVIDVIKGLFGKTDTAMVNAQSEQEELLSGLEQMMNTVDGVSALDSKDKDIVEHFNSLKNVYENMCVLFCR